MKKGFTLIELLIVIGILAILATTVVLVLNPAQLLSETRDTQRISDLDTMRNALSLYLATVTPLPADAMGVSANCYAYDKDSGVAFDPPLTANCEGRHAGKTTTQRNDRTTTSSGWVPVALNTMPGGSPVAVLPIDPTNKLDTTAGFSAGDLFYSYLGSNTAGATFNQFEINANMESAKFANLGGSDKESTDGGSNPDIYEVGTNLSL